MRRWFFEERTLVNDCGGIYLLATSAVRPRFEML